MAHNHDAVAAGKFHDVRSGEDMDVMHFNDGVSIGGEGLYSRHCDGWCAAGWFGTLLTTMTGTRSTIFICRTTFVHWRRTRLRL